MKIGVISRRRPEGHFPRGCREWLLGWKDLIYPHSLKKSPVMFSRSLSAGRSLSIVIIFSEVQCITDWNSEYTVRDITVKETRTLQLWDNPVFPYGSLRSIVVVQSLSHVWLFVTPWTAAYKASLPFTISQSLLWFMSIVSVMPSNHLFLCCPLLFPSIFSSIGVFSNESALHIKWSKYWSFSFSIRLSSEYSGLISFGIGWFDLLVVQGTLKSLLWHHNLKNINSLVLSLFYDPTLTSVHDYWKNHSFD